MEAYLALVGQVRCVRMHVRLRARPELIVYLLAGKRCTLGSAAEPDRGLPGESCRTPGRAATRQLRDTCQRCRCCWQHTANCLGTALLALLWAACHGCLQQRLCISG